MKTETIVNTIIKAFKRSPIVFCVMIIGTIAQSFHTFQLAWEFSAMSSYGLQVLSSLFIAIFFSMGLLIFSVKLGLVKPSELDTQREGKLKFEDRRKYRKIATGFQWFEIFINQFFYIKKWVYIGKGQFDFTDWFPLIACSIFGFALPTILRYYAGEIGIDMNIRNEYDKILHEISKLNNAIQNRSFKMKINKEFNKDSGTYDNVELIPLNEKHEN